MKLSRRCCLSLLALTLFAPASGAIAQAYPNKPVRLVVADAPGGAPDQLGRLSRKSSGMASASRSSSTIVPARAACWAPRWSPSRKQMATRCC
jgi:tripartite-type tricarboxylate transporter receptor subunit TctC